jgi:hypothetical protein
VLFGFLYKDKKTTGYIDIGGMFAHPKDMEFNLQNIIMLVDQDDRDGLCREIFGQFYVKDKKPSSISQELMRMSKEVKAGEDSFANKMRYLLWIN